MKVSEIKFKKVPLKEAKNVSCNYCEKVGFTAGWFQAILRFMAGAKVTIFVCSDDCKKKFFSNPKTQTWLDGVLKMVREHHTKKQTNGG